jgi:hypothetical protein
VIGRAILTAEEMRSAEATAINGGVSVETLMERAGAGAPKRSGALQVRCRLWSSAAPAIMAATAM